MAKLHSYRQCRAVNGMTLRVSLSLPTLWEEGVLLVDSRRLKTLHSLGLGALRSQESKNCFEDKKCYLGKEYLLWGT